MYHALCGETTETKIYPVSLCIFFAYPKIIWMDMWPMDSLL